MLDLREASGVIEARRWLHQHPELSGEERETAAWVAARLEGLGLAPRVGGYGAETSVVAVIEGGAGDGPTLAWRADIDALPILEEAPVAWASRRAGVMHACGHDVHTAVGLGIAARLVEVRARLRGRVVMIFQPAEEGAPGLGVVGAEAMARGGVLESQEIDGVLALHCMPDMAVGQVGFLRGPVWAGSDAWRLTIHGKQTHGAYPQDGVDPIYVAGQLIVALQSIAGRVVDAREPCVVSVGSVRAGEAFNVIPGEAHLVGLVRTLGEGARARALEALERLTHGICAAHGATATLTTSRGAHPVINDPALVDQVVGALRLPPGALVEGRPQLGAEDFASFSRRRPGAYFFLGVGQPGAENAPIHSPRFCPDEGALSVGVEAFAGALARMLAAG